MNKPQDTAPLRLRFAPSPTGSLHVGGARTALFNYLLARRTHGTFILRIEDTDASRNRPESEADVLEDLRWLGLSWQEGPDVGGPFAPYRQSERGELYAAAAKELLESNAAYPCFCSPEELAADQAAQRAEGIVATKYGRRCAELTSDQRAEHVNAGRSAALRLRIPPGRTEIHDQVHGLVCFDHLQLGDLVLVRANGMPTYNFVAAVDDAAMEIDVVIRGDEHLANTPYQMIVLQALGKKIPSYAHVPLILNEDHQKLSKRHQTVGVASYRNEGYLASALIDHLVLLGWSPGDDSEHWSLDELAAIFRLERVGRAPSVYNGARLRAFNARAIRALAPDELTAVLATRLQEAGFAEAAADPKWMAAFVEAYGEELEVLGEAALRAHVLLGPPPSFDEAQRASLETPAAEAYLQALKALANEDGTLGTTPLKTLIPMLGKTHGLSTKEAYMLLRLVMIGSEHGPPLVPLVTLLGPQRLRERLAQV